MYHITRRRDSALSTIRLRFFFILFIYCFLKMELKFVLNGMFRFRLREFTEKLLQELYDVYTYFASSQI
jgi:hypothetical protein